ncbi:MAG: transcriptional regulator [Clostridiales bacterium GWF2_38_85]|nr:MAG: transcriptional regulator [Clostridiales bacterium GWF2_38_85]HBL84242.1 transcriptional regulator [Clostridiales bacterium]
MKEINIAKILVLKRKEKGITQDELAEYIGVSKASVSKWETANSYPDINFLPWLATYFNISIDELIDYAPQMEKNDIKKLYHKLAADFGKKPFDTVIKECREIVKKYYSCFPLLLQITILLLNHHMLAKTKEEQVEILQEAIDLCNRIKSESDDLWLVKQANMMQASCLLILQKPIDVIDMLGEDIHPTLNEEALLARAYQMKGNLQKSKEVWQIGIYQHIISAVDFMLNYLLLHSNEPEKFRIILNRLKKIADIFELDNLAPNSMLQMYLVAAQAYVIQEETEKALNMLTRYADVCDMFSKSLYLHGDSFFDCIESWFNEFDLGTEAPRDQKIVKQSMLQAVEANPTFQSLAETPRYKSIIQKLKLI